MPSQRKHISVHIEKTAGTSLRAFFNDLYGPEYVYTHSPTQDVFRRTSEMLFPWTYALIQPFRKRFGENRLFLVVFKLYRFIVSRRQKLYSFDNLPADYRVLHGHFCADQFGKRVDNPMLTVVLRDPLARMISHYNHLMERKKDTDWRVHSEKLGEMTFEEFALCPEMKNYQTQAFGPYTYDDFDIVGTVEHLEDFMRKLEALVCGRSSYVGGAKRFNESPGNYRKKYPITDEFVKKFKDFHERDYELWERAMSL